MKLKLLTMLKLDLVPLTLKGDFRVGDLFHVEQDTGTVNFSADALNIDLTSGVITDGFKHYFYKRLQE